MGLGLHHGARICAAGHGRQLLASAATAAILGEADLPFGLVDLGIHRLKDISQPEHLFQVNADGLPDRFPPLRTVEKRVTNLPGQATPLIGRQSELAEVVAALRRDGVRIVTLTGAGGSGKTRLAIQAAAEVLDDYRDGVFFVPLATITEPGLVLPGVTEALGLSEAAGQSLTGYPAPKQLLLVLDNLEQVIEAAGDLAKLLGSAPGGPDAGDQPGAAPRLGRARAPGGADGVRRRRLAVRGTGHGRIVILRADAPEPVGGGGHLRAARRVAVGDRARRGADHGAFARGDAGATQRSVEAANRGRAGQSCYELQGMAMAAAGMGNAERALRLAAAADATLRRLGVESLPPFWTALVDGHVAMARERLGTEAADAAWAAGAHLIMPSAVDEALHGSASSSTSRA